jgi:hypothetical protein
MTEMADIFRRLSAGRPPPAGRAQDHSSAQKLLDWVLRWDKPTVRIRDIRIYGPGPLRNRKSAIDTAEVLVSHGWLVPTSSRKRRHDGRTWQIVRRAIVHPTIGKQSSSC